jgi:hypothetical protein
MFHGVKGGRPAPKAETTSPQTVRFFFIENVGASTSHNPMGLRPVTGTVCLFRRISSNSFLNYLLWTAMYDIMSSTVRKRTFREISGQIRVLWLPDCCCLAHTRVRKLPRLAILKQDVIPSTPDINYWKLSPMLWKSLNQFPKLCASRSENQNSAVHLSLSKNIICFLDAQICWWACSGPR